MMSANAAVLESDDLAGVAGRCADGGGAALGGSQPAGDHCSGEAVGESASLGGSALGVHIAGLRRRLRSETFLTGFAAASAMR